MHNVGASDKSEVSTKILNYFQKMSGPDKKGNTEQTYTSHIRPCMAIERRKFYSR